MSTSVKQTQESKEPANPALEAALATAPGGKVVDATQVALDAMQAYVKSSGCNKILQDLYERIVVEQPSDPVAFLIRVVEEHKLSWANP